VFKLSFRRNAQNSEFTLESVPDSRTRRIQEENDFTPENIFKFADRLLVFLLAEIGLLISWISKKDTSKSIWLTHNEAVFVFSIIFLEALLLLLGYFEILDRSKNTILGITRRNFWFWWAGLIWTLFLTVNIYSAVLFYIKFIN